MKENNEIITKKGKTFSFSLRLRKRRYIWIRHYFLYTLIISINWKDCITSDLIEIFLVSVFHSLLKVKNNGVKWYE